MNDVNALYDQFLQKSEQISRMPAALLSLAQSAEELSTKIEDAVKSFGGFNWQLKGIADYLAHCDGPANEFSDHVLTVHRKFHVFEEEAKVLSERLIQTLAKPVVNDQTIYAAHLKHMRSICDSFRFMNLNGKRKITKKITGLKRKTLNWNAKVFLRKRLLKRAQLAVSMDGVPKDKYELFFLKAISELLQDQMGQASLFVERLFATAAIQLPLTAVKADSKYTSENEIAESERYAAYLKQTSKKHVPPSSSAKFKSAAEKAIWPIKEQATRQRFAKEIKFPCSVEEMSRYESPCTEEGKVNDFVSSCTTTTFPKTCKAVEPEAASIQLNGIYKCERKPGKGSVPHNEGNVTKIKTPKFTPLTKQKSKSETKTNKPSYRKSTIASAGKVTLRYEERKGQKCQGAAAGIPGSLTPKSAKKGVEQSSVKASKTKNFTSKIPCPSQAFKDSKSLKQNSGLGTPLSCTVGSGLHGKIEVNASLKATRQKETHLVRKISSEESKQSSSMSFNGTKKAPSQVTADLHASKDVRKKINNGTRLTSIVDQEMETMRKGNDALINVCLESVSADKSTGTHQ